MFFFLKWASFSLKLKRAERFPSIRLSATRGPDDRLKEPRFTHGVGKIVRIGWEDMESCHTLEPYSLFPGKKDPTIKPF